MSNVYQGIVVAADGVAVKQFLDEYPARLALRLAQLAPGVLGIYWFELEYGRLIDFDAEERLAQRLSAEFGPALAVFWDDRSDVDMAIQFAGGLAIREFGKADEIWVPYNADGTLDLDGPRYAGDQIPTDVECDGIQGAIDAGLIACEWGKLKQSDLMDAFGDDGYGWLAEWPASPD